TAMKADRIVVVDNGQIAEIGTHHGLVATGGIYAGMYAAWITHGGRADTSVGSAGATPGT
ncbi:MAG: hypothetical protein ACRDV8_08950, partial [Acidimicrobiales bacterium]